MGIIKGVKDCSHCNDVYIDRAIDVGHMKVLECVRVFSYCLDGCTFEIDGAVLICTKQGGQLRLNMGSLILC